MLGSLSLTFYQLLYAWGLQLTAAGDASLVVALNPLITSVMSIFLLHDPMSIRRLLGLCCGLAGVALVAFHSPNTDIPLSDRLLGDLLILGCAFCYATYTVLMRKYLTGGFVWLGDYFDAGCCRSRVVTGGSQSSLPLTGQAAITSDHGDPEANKSGLVDAVYKPDVGRTTSAAPVFAPPLMKPLALVTWNHVVAAVSLSPFALYEQPWQVSLDLRAWLYILFLAALASCFSFWAYAYGTEKLGAPRASVFINFVPVFGVLVSWIALSEQLGWEHGLSLVLVWTGVLLVNLAPKGAFLKIPSVLSASDTGGGSSALGDARVNVQLAVSPPALVTTGDTIHSADDASPSYDSALSREQIHGSDH